MPKISFKQIYEDAQTYADYVDMNPSIGLKTVHFKLHIIDPDDPSNYSFERLPKKGKIGQKIKTFNLSRNNCQPILFDDNLAYVVGLPTKKDNGEKKHAAFVQLVRECVEAYPLRENQVFLQWLESVDKDDIKSEIKALHPVKTDEEITDFVVIPYVSKKRLSDIPQNRDFWLNHFYSKVVDINDINNDGVCSITGEQTKVLSHIIPRKIKGVPNTQPAGGSIISFDKPNSCCWGRKNGENAPIGVKVACDIHSFLDHLLADNNHHHRVGDRVIVYWAQNGIGLNPNEIREYPVDVNSDDNSPQIQDELHRLFTYPYRGESNVTDSDMAVDWDTKIRFLVLKGNAGRIAILDSTAITAKALVENNLRFKSCLPEHVKLQPWMVMKSYSISKSVDINEMNYRFQRSLLFGEPLPEQFIRLVLHAVYFEGGISPSRLAAIKFYLALKGEIKMTPENQYAELWGKVCWTIHCAQELQRGKGCITNVIKNFKSLAQNAVILKARLLQDAHKIYFNFNTVPSESCGLLGKALKLYEAYSAEIKDVDAEGTMTSIQFTTEQQIMFVRGFDAAAREYYQAKELVVTAIAEQEEQ